MLLQSSERSIVKMDVKYTEYYDRRKIVVNLGLVRLYSEREGDGLKGVDGEYRYFSPLQVSLY